MNYISEGFKLKKKLGNGERQGPGMFPLGPLGKSKGEMSGATFGGMFLGRR